MRGRLQGRRAPGAVGADGQPASRAPPPPHTQTHVTRARLLWPAAVDLNSLTARCRLDAPRWRRERAGTEMAKTASRRRTRCPSPRAGRGRDESWRRRQQQRGCVAMGGAPPTTAGLARATARTVKWREKRRDVAAVVIKKRIDPTTMAKRRLARLLRCDLMNRRRLASHHPPCESSQTQSGTCSPLRSAVSTVFFY